MPSHLFLKHSAAIRMDNTMTGSEKSAALCLLTKLEEAKQQADQHKIKNVAQAGYVPAK